MTSEPLDRPLDRDDVVTAIHPLLPLVERLGDRVLLVGTVSSCPRGISLPVADVDILARERPVVDDLAHAMAAAGGRRLSDPEWVTNPAFGQYFSAYDMAGVRVEVSTVEVAPRDAVSIGECTGDEPWSHADVVRVEGRLVRVVASELRLLSEVARSTGTLEADFRAALP